ncbi:MAG: deoxyribodipyrimidine photo-lyase [Simkaniaceae bacterium]
MIHLIYVEKEIQDHPRVKKILQRFPDLPTVTIDRYGEIFNRAKQNFRLQKQFPALILAKKYGKFLHQIPQNYGIGQKYNFYFSHILNCPFDCGYCFLQGMYRSGYYVLFVNYEDFQQEIQKAAARHSKNCAFFSGYDGDSLALESLTSFAEEFLSFAETLPHALFELRTKSIFIKPLLERKPLANCVIAYSLNPEIIAKEIEKKTPPLHKRLQSLLKLQNQGWPIGLRFDPIVLHHNFQKEYIPFFEQIFQSLSEKNIHSVTLGSLRLPQGTYRQMMKNAPHDKILATLTEQTGFFSYSPSIEREILQQCQEKILQYIPKNKLFVCSGQY